MNVVVRTHDGCVSLLVGEIGDVIECEMLRSYGARAYVENEATRVVWGMPGFRGKGGIGG